MIQEIIVYIIIGVVFLILVRGAFKMFMKKGDSSGCAGCSGCDIKPTSKEDKDNKPNSCCH
ncbi:FeoB-associated Cys-rich membrane protein [Porphyromonas sp.]|uniref:FeoB-associated Cys-rich membrane protein n=1 Tax=Porphyromonas sp. TaxID=1924944 RepID=UPI0026DA988E|nr:FeoB-associated Cys-rich membrane protein [Porphyromonas sp.]MDO4771616.1 FeoB-associated Cys-rich membrane protein [Porphyromonas sp.]